ncbi:MAG: cyclic nucleotide-binding domain-containing protein [bacterium]|nr:cyclic nucleotide-binding domain-containing protein [bacterium]
MKKLAEALFGNVRKNERQSFTFFCLLFGLITLSQTLGLAGSESLFLSIIGIEKLSQALIAASLTTVAGSLLYAKFVDSRRNDTYFAQMLAGSGLTILALSILSGSKPFLLYVIYCIYYLTFAVFLNHFWTFAGDYFDTLSSKRLFPLFTVGSSAGGLIGGAAGEFLNTLFGPAALLYGWAATLAAAAAMIMLNKRRLRTWGPLNVAEADETSISGIQSSLKYIVRSPLSLWLLFSASSMVLALFIAQYLYSNIFAATFPEADKLASFMNKYLIVTNFLEIVIEIAITPFFIARLGVARTNLLHPIMTTISFILLGLFPGLNFAVISRVNRELMENALAGPVRSLVYNALPARLRGQMRAFLEGVVIYSGMTTAGILLLYFGNASITALSVSGAILSCLYFIGNYQVYREYIQTIVTELKAGRLNLEDVGNNLGSYDAAYLAELWTNILKEDSGRPSSAALEMTKTLAEYKIIKPLLDNAGHPSPILRRTIIKVLGTEKPSDEILRTVAHACHDDVAEVSLEALETLGKLKPSLAEPDGNAKIREAIADLMESPNPKIKAKACSLMGTPGDNTLESMTLDANTAAIALRYASSRQTDLLKAHVDSDNNDIAASALERLSETAKPVPVEFALLSRLAVSPSIKVRRSAFKALGTLDSLEASALLASGLTAPNRDLRKIAAEELKKNVDLHFSAVRDYLQADEVFTIEAAAEVLASSDNANAKLALNNTMLALAEEAWKAELLQNFWQKVHADAAADGEGAVASGGNGAASGNGEAGGKVATASEVAASGEDAVASGDEVAACADGAAGGEHTNAASISPVRKEFLETALANAISKNIGIIFYILERTESPTIVKSIAKELHNPHSKFKSDALEILSNLGDREASRLLVLMSENGPLEDKLSSLPATLVLPKTIDEAINLAENFNDRWVRLACNYQKEDVMERLLVLRKVPLFNNMTLDQLEAINKIIKESQYLKGEVIFKEGDVGTELFLLVDGSVNIIKQMGTPLETVLVTLSGINYFGEMAILDDEPRSASVVVEDDASLLSLDGDSFKELITEIPDIAFEIFRILTQRVRKSEKALNDYRKANNL